MSWNRAFTIAIIQKNPEKLGKLIEEMPIIKDVEEAKHAQALIQEALKIMKEAQFKIRDSMEKNKKTRAFLMSANLGYSSKREYRG
jgi:hypothetical protein